MAAVYVNLYHRLNVDLSLPRSIIDSGYAVECLKDMAPDDGEAISVSGKYCITCADDAWKAVIEKLRLSGRGLVYSVVLSSPDGETFILEAGELNSEVEHYSTRLRDSKQIFNFWFEDFLPGTIHLHAA